MFGLWEPFVMIGGLAFWLVAIVLSILLVIALEVDSGKGAVTVATLFLAFLIIATPFNPFTWLLENPVTFLIYAGVYFLVGSGWSFLKWIFYVLRRREEARVAKATYAEGNFKEKFEDWILMRYSGYRDRHYPPQVSSHKSDLVFWATWWPWSAFWTLLNDPIRHIWNFIYNLFGATLQRVTNRLFQSV